MSMIALCVDFVAVVVAVELENVDHAHLKSQNEVHQASEAGCEGLQPRNIFESGLPEWSQTLHPASYRLRSEGRDLFDQRSKGLHHVEVTMANGIRPVGSGLNDANNQVVVDRKQSRYSHLYPGLSLCL